MRAELGEIFLNKLGVKKARIIWDLRESKVNQRCDQAERVILPRLLDVVHDCLHLIREGEDPMLVAVDIQDAFHSIASGADKRYTVAAADVDGSRQFIIYDVLVFGSRSSPTIWGLGGSMTLVISALCGPLAGERWPWVSVACLLGRRRPRSPVARLSSLRASLGLVRAKALGALVAFRRALGALALWGVLPAASGVPGCADLHSSPVEGCMCRLRPSSTCPRWSSL